jgi:[acyl-carrier-protein] S-malonyltransferase
MGGDFYERFDQARRRFDEANEILGRDIKTLCFQGPREELTATQNTQPALFTTEAVIADVLKANGMNPAVCLGHSLGEYGALYAAGVFSFRDGLQLVARRGELMAKAGESSPGTMAAVIGFSREKIAEVLNAVDGIVVPANENTPEQTVISGTVEAVKEAGEKLATAGAKRVVPLSVSGAFHSPLMQSAANAFSEEVNKVEFSAPACPVVTNVTAGAETDPQRLKELLLQQLVSPVRWVDSMQFLVSQNALSCYEVGPGSVLKGLARKCDRSLNVVSCDTADNVYSLLRSE